MVYLPMVARPGYHPVTLPMGINSGGPAKTLLDGRHLVGDMEYLSTRGAGYVGGRAVTNDLTWEDINGTEDDFIYRSGRAGASEYRFDVPNGSYLVELSLAEINKNSAGLRQFSVAIENRPVLVDLDLYALAQHDYAVRYRFAADVLDRQLNVSLSPTVDETLINAIWVAQRAPDLQPPAAPSTTKVVGGYGEALVRWPASQADDVAGYYVYKSQSVTGPFVRVSATPTPLTRYFDRDVTVGQQVCYRASGVDVFGNEGAQSPSSCAQIIDFSATSLPVFHLTIDPDDLLALNIDPRANIEVPAVLEQGGQTYDVEAEYRGSSTQFSNKKSWKLVADEPFAYSGQETLLLNGEGHDPASIRDKLVYGLFADAGVRPLAASFVDIDLNGRFIGVFTQVENPDADFLRRTGRNPFGDVFKCRDGLDSEPNCSNEVAADRNMEDLYNFAAVVNRTPDDEFASAIAEVLDVREFLDYQAVTMFTNDLDATHQYLLISPSATERWQILPWDNDASFRDGNVALDYGTASNPAYGTQVNVLLTRMLDVPQYRRYYGDRILELIDGTFSSTVMASRLAQIRTEAWFDLERDTWKTHREDNDAALLNLNDIQILVNRRIDYLRNAVPAFVPARDTYLAINEVMTRNSSTVIDPADGQAEPWFEIYNAGVNPVDLGGMYVSDNPTNPTRYRFASGTVVPAFGGLLFWADGEPQQGPDHVNFTLYGNGGQLRLTAADGVTNVDTLSVPPLAMDASWARFPDQSGSAMRFSRPTPGLPNRLPAPEIAGVTHTPTYPQASESATVRARIVDDNQVAHAEVIYKIGVTSNSAAMYDDGLHDDGAAHDGLYAGQIPAMPDGTVVRYYIAATDDTNRTSFHPFAAPVLTHDYRVGFLPPPVAISEFMADNETTIMDPDEPGEFPDWIEVTNLTQAPVDLGGYYLTDKLTTPTKYRIPNGTVVAAGEAVIFWADDDGTQGPFHTNFKLSADGESVGLFDPDGVTPITAFEFGPQLTDVSFGQCPPPDGTWDFHHLPTPGAPNACSRVFFPAAPVE
ncbi:MAG: CotH kinase family protein [Caldilineales bacterium]